MCVCVCACVSVCVGACERVRVCMRACVCAKNKMNFVKFDLVHFSDHAVEIHSIGKLWNYSMVCDCSGKPRPELGSVHHHHRQRCSPVQPSTY